MRLSVIIVNYNVAAFTAVAVRALLRAEVAGGLEVFVVDNASTDGSAERLAALFPAKDFPQVHHLPQQENLGFGRANNLAARRAKGDYILFLNPDTLPSEHLPARLLAFADAHPDVGAVGVSMTNDDGTFAPESRRGLPTPWTAFCKMAGLTALYPRSRRFGHYYMGYLPNDAPHETEVVSGACMMVRNDGRGDWFDPDYFMYGEDIDLSYRLMQEGKTNWYVPADLVHFKGESTNKTTYRYAHVFYGAMLIFLRKHYPRYAFWLRPFIAAAIWATAAKGWLHGRWADLRYRLSRSGNAPQPVPARFVGTHFLEAAAVAEADGLRLQPADVTTLRDGDTLPAGALDDCELAVFDTADCAPSAIIRNLKKAAGRVRLALFDPALRRIVTHGAGGL
ncbi:MAG: glycosyltransferase family 2 protein [Bacteroidaceae bacterium]|nr:glycosyltransferase family 2 protein [Bacteroidaceae bacterium]